MLKLSARLPPYWHWAHQCTDTHTFCCCTPYTSFFLDFISINLALRSLKVSTLNMIIWFPFWGTYSWATGPNSATCWATGPNSAGLMHGCDESYCIALSKSSYCIFLSCWKYLKNSGPHWGFSNLFSSESSRVPKLSTAGMGFSFNSGWGAIFLLEIRGYITGYRSIIYEIKLWSSMYIKI